MFSSKTERFFFVFGPWCTLYEPCALKRLRRFQAKKKSEPKKKRKHIENFLCRCGFNKCVFVGNGVNFFFRFRPLVHPIGAVRTEKTKPFSGQKKTDPKKIEKHVEKIYFSLRFQNMCLRRKRSDFRDFFVFGPWYPLLGVRTDPNQYLIR